MKEDYDFRGAERGKFHIDDAILVPPVHLETDVLTFLAACAEARGASLSDLVNDLLRASIGPIEDAG